MRTRDAARPHIEALAAAGVRAVDDPRSAQPPCVLFTPPERRYDLGLPSFTAVWTLVLLAPGAGNADAWDALDDLATTVLEVLEDLLDGTTVRPASYQLPAGGEPCPAYLINLTEGL